MKDAADALIWNNLYIQEAIEQHRALVYFVYDCSNDSYYIL